MYFNKYYILIIYLTKTIFNFSSQTYFVCEFQLIKRDKNVEKLL